jgi:aromatic ring-cleaving dioxygenase
MLEAAGVIGTRTIASYHAHIYFRSPEERERALGIRELIGERFVLQLGRIHDKAVGSRAISSIPSSPGSCSIVRA